MIPIKTSSPLLPATGRPCGIPVLARVAPALLLAGLAFLPWTWPAAQTTQTTQGTADPAADGAGPAGALPEDQGSIDPFADLLVARFADYLGSAERFRVTAEITHEQLLESGHKIQLARSVALHVRRPDRLRAEVRSDSGEMRFYYDGRTLGVHDLARNVFAVSDVADNIDDMVDQVKNRYDVSMPLADLLVADVYENYRERITSGTYVGLHQLGGVRHHHLLLSNDEVDYQIWIEDGPRPLPRRIVATYPNETGVPQHTVRITGWDFQPRLPDLVFEFHPPADGDEVEFLRVGEAQP